MSTPNCVARNFSAAAATYDDAADIQAICGQRLVEKLQLFLGPEYAPQTIVELGCGTGALTQLISSVYPDSVVDAYDIAEAMIAAASARLFPAAPQNVWARIRTSTDGNAEYVREIRHSSTDAPRVPDSSQTALSLRYNGETARVRFTQADCEALLLRRIADVNISNFSVQWFDDPLASLTFHAGQSRHIAWTILLEGTFARWKRLYAALGSTARTRQFPSAAALHATVAAIEPARFCIEVTEHQQSFSSAHDFVRSLKNIGAQAPAHEQTADIPLRKVLRTAPRPFIAEYCVATVLLAR